MIGVLQAVDTAVDRFDTAHLELLESLAATAAIAIENARLYEELERRVEKRTAELAKANEALQESEEKYRSLVEGYIDGIAIV